MNGREWLRWFRTAAADSPVIVIVAYKIEDDAEFKRGHPGKALPRGELLDL